MSDVEDEAIDLVAKAVAEHPHQKALAAAICRQAGKAYAKLTAEGEAADLHFKGFRYHDTRASQAPRKSGSQR